MLDVGQEVWVAGYDPDVTGVALVAASSVGQVLEGEAVGAGLDLYASLLHWRLKRVIDFEF